MEITSVQQKERMIQGILREPYLTEAMRQVDEIPFYNNPFRISHVTIYDGKKETWPLTLRGVPYYAEKVPVDEKSHYRFIMIAHVGGNATEPLTLMQVEKPKDFKSKYSYCIARTVTPEFLASQECLLFSVSPAEMQARGYQYLVASKALLDAVGTLPPTLTKLPMWATSVPSIFFRNIEAGFDAPNSLFLGDK